MTRKLVQDAILKLLDAQIRRTLEVNKIKGWEFPSKYDVGVAMVTSENVNVRMDKTIIGTTTTKLTDSLVKVVDELVEKWLEEHATARPTKKHRATP
jgi:hypothetical protein